MNKKKQNAKHLHSRFHISYLTFFPVLILVAIALFSFSLWKAHNDLRRIGNYLRFDKEDLGIREKSIYYRVQYGDTLESIAKKFSISIETIMWANDIPESGIENDMIISIPPTTGIIHAVQSGETVESIAKTYGVDPYVIYNYPFNEFTKDVEFPINPGQTLMIPGGTKNPIRIKDILGIFWKRMWE
ncbi:MAG: Lipoprotein [Candidatus Roizmanbacteria bacterium GW2011_GWA2_37_7]|uniref:Lipoprotein n=1 Tax=Candidatus Roizmanbacteria bacterium GW2011_GWA2_37_7 TaxID=1618481 RepID=A0A0G0H985_9BACT|nr:MAG: Lipoprotein [Candidatus Roizmanbacteria bacterium GW2011_GWA2_37_7]